MSNVKIPLEAEKVLSPEQCKDIVYKASKFINNGGGINVGLFSHWRGNTRWSRNEIISSGDDRANSISIGRDINGANAFVTVSNFSDSELKRAVEIAERRLQLKMESPVAPAMPSLPLERAEIPAVWFDSTVNLDEDRRADIYHELTRSIEANNMVSAGYLQVNASVVDLSDRLENSGRRNHRHTESQLSITVRTPDGTGSGWAGLSWSDWDRIDGHKIASIALDKCMKSRNAVVIEPGRYIVVLEPQATHDIVKPLFDPKIMDRRKAENPRMSTIYTLNKGASKIGLRLFDSRLKVSTDPYHPNASYYPYRQNGELIRPATWVEEGVLKELAYSLDYGIQTLRKNQGLVGSRSYLMEGIGSNTNSSVGNMVSNTERGLLVTRFHITTILDEMTMMTSGLTRDGLWLIEKGKISKPVKNLRFTESPLFMLNNILEYGVPTRVFNPGNPVMVPAIRAQDFSFTATADAI